MKKLLFFSTVLSALSGSAYAASYKYDNWEFTASGLMGGYYGISQTKKQYATNSMPNRWVYRTDALFGANYHFSPDHQLGVFGNFTLVFREHDKDYRNGDWRFYPFITDKSKYGELTVGYVYSAAHELHKGAKDITFFGIDDSNMIYYLSNPNWGNGKHSTKFATPKSTSIMVDGRAAKIKYITPELFGNTKFGFSYTPENDNRRGMVSRYADYESNEDGVTAAMQNRWELPDDSTLYTSFGYGIFNGTDNEMSFGVTWVKDKFNIAAGYKNAWVNGNKNPITYKSDNPYLPALFDNYRESDAYNISVGYQFTEKFKSNLAYLHTEAKNTRNSDDLYIFSNVYSANKYIDLFLIGAYLNAKGADKYADDNSKGYAAITGIGLKF